MIDVSICIVNWNTRDLLGRCIRSIREKTVGLSYEIIVVDNNSSDGSAEMLRSSFSECKILGSHVNLGFARGNNLCIERAMGKYVLFLNPDTELMTNALYGMFTFLESAPEVGAAGCRLVYPDGRVQYTCASALPTPMKELTCLLLLNRLFRKSELFSAREIDYWDHMDSREVECLSGACIMARRDLLDRLGGFDEKIFMYSEDLDLCLRILREGLKVYYLSTEVIMHYEGASTREMKNKNFPALQQKCSNYYYMRKNFGTFRAECFRMAVFTGSLFRLVIISPLLLAVKCGLVKKDTFPPNAFDKYAKLFFWSITHHTT